MPTFVTSDGAALDYTDEGSGSAVVLIGGYGMGSRAWTLQREALAPTHRVLGFDRRCHGASECSWAGQRLTRHAADLHEFLSELDVEAASLVGASMGASVIWAYCDLFGTDRLSRIVTVDQTPKMVNDEEWDLGFYDLTWDGVHEFVTTFPAGRVPFHIVPPAEVVQLMTGPSNFSFDATRALLRDHTVADWRDVLPRIDVPLLAIAGRHCPFWPPASSEFVAKTVPYGDVVVFEDSGHVPFLEQPEAFNEILGGFLS